MTLRLVNWNVEWATPNSRRTTEIVGRIDRHVPEVACLTEAHVGLLSQRGHIICSQPDYGYRVKEGRRKVVLWSREPWNQVDDLGSTLCLRDDLSLESHRLPWGRLPSSESVFPGSVHGLRQGEDWIVRCSGEITNSILPVLLTYSVGDL